jgi:hypothetical protein
MKSSYGDITVEVPRDRKGEFTPQLAKKNQTTLTGDIEEKIISMYAKGMTTFLRCVFPGAVNLGREYCQDFLQAFA